MNNDQLQICEQLAIDLINADKVLLFTGEAISPLGKDSIDTLFNNPDAVDCIEEIPAVHLAIKKLYDLQIINKVITQNIDNLHIKSGISEEDVINIHGSFNEFQCDRCSTLYTDIEWDFTVFQLGDYNSKICGCGGSIKSTVIDFGKTFDAEKMQLAKKIALEADICLVIGSQLNEYPSSNFPRIVGLRKKLLVIINSEETKLDFIASIKIDLDATDVLSCIINSVRNWVTADSN